MGVLLRRFLSAACFLTGVFGPQLYAQVNDAPLKVIQVTAKQPTANSAPGVLAGKTLYVAGQEGLSADGSLPADFKQEVAQSLSKMREVLRAGGMDFGNVVTMTVFMTHLSDMDAMNDVYWKTIGAKPPARTILGIADLPYGAHIEISAIAVSSAARRQVIHPQGWPQGAHIDPAGIQADDVLYISGQGGIDPLTGKVAPDYAAESKQALDNVAAVAKAAGMSMANVVWVNPYWTTTDGPLGPPQAAGAAPSGRGRQNESGVMSKIYATYFEFGNTPGRGTRQMAELPNKTHIVFTCIAGADLSKRKAIRPFNEGPSATASPGVLYDDTYYMSGKNAFVPGTGLGMFTHDLLTQFHYVIRNLLDDLQATDLDFSDVVSSTLYMREIKDLDQVEPLYAGFFKAKLPARSVLVNNLDLKSDTYVEMSLIAVRQPKK